MFKSMLPCLRTCYVHLRCSFHHRLDALVTKCFDWWQALTCTCRPESFLVSGHSICLSRAVPSRGSDRGLEISLIFYLLLQALQDSQSRRACTQSSAAGRQPCKQLGGRCGGRRGAAHGGCQQRVLRRNGGGCGGRLADVAGRGCSALAASRRGRNACRGTLRAMSLPLHGCGL